MKDQPIIIVKKSGHGHHGHHGGAWKVAYADFVTAMMAFFLVMWIVGQSNPMKAGVAGYFRDPGVFDRGTGGAAGILPGAPKGITAPLPTPTDERPSPWPTSVLEQAAQRLREAFEQLPEFAKIKDRIEIEVTSEGLRIELVDDLNESFFEVGTRRAARRDHASSCASSPPSSASCPTSSPSKGTPTAAPSPAAPATATGSCRPTAPTPRGARWRSSGLSRRPGRRACAASPTAGRTSPTTRSTRATAASPSSCTTRDERARWRRSWSPTTTPSGARWSRASCERPGHAAVTAADGVEAWKLIESLKPPLAVLDWDMPGLTGLDVLRRVKLTRGPHAARTCCS